MRGTDGERVRAVLAGDRSAFGDLYDRHAGWVRAVLYDTTRDLAAAQDLAQEVFLRAFGKLRTLREPERFGAWLMSIARHAAFEWLRQSAGSRQQHLSEEFDCPAPAHEGIDADSIQCLQEAVRSLPERERLAVLVFYLQEQSADEACLVLNLSRAGLYRVLSRARKRLERLLNRDRENVP